MDLNEAYEQVTAVYQRGEVEESLHYLFDTPEDDKLLRALRLSSAAAQLGLWECAEVIMEDPVLKNSPFNRSGDTKYYFLGIDAAELEDFERAREYFAKSDLGPGSGESVITRILIEKDRLDEATEAIREVDFTKIDHSSTQTNLAKLVYKMSKKADGPRVALELVKELVPDPNRTEAEDEGMEKKRFDYFIETIPTAAIEQDDFETAEEAVELTSDWFGPGAAMGGGGLLDQAYESEDSSVLPAILCLVYRKWGVGNLTKVLNESRENIRESVKERIIIWLNEIKNKNYETPRIQSMHEQTIPEIEKLIELYS